jgi:membrane protein implicated in regulation of membrane protease activity
MNLLDPYVIYWILFLLGLGFAVISGVLAGFADLGGHMDMGGHDFGGHMDAGSAHDVTTGHGDMGDTYHGQGEIQLSPVSPMTIFAFVGGFGGGGLIGMYLNLPIWGSLLIALPTGFLIAFGIYYLMASINKTNISSEARASDVIGITAEIITPITDDGMGEVAYNNRGSRYNSPARSVDGVSIAKGRPVKIWRVVGGTCYVKEIHPEEAEHPETDVSDRRAKP